MSKHHIIYIPGIGDHKPYYQPQILSFWRIFGVTPHYHPVIWRGNENFDSKLIKIVALIDKLHNDGKTVSLVGVSAGATAAFNAYMKRPDKISSVVYICGKLKRPQTIGEYYHRTNPAFIQSITLVHKQIADIKPKDSSKMLSLRPLYDQTVMIRDMALPGVRNLRMLSIFHVPSIFIGITFYSPLISAFIRKKK